MGEGDEPVGGDPEAEEVGDATPRKARRGSGLAQGLGNALVAYDDMVLGRQPSSEIHVQLDRTHTVSPAQGLTIELPDDTPAGSPEGDAPESDEP